MSCPICFENIEPSDELKLKCNHSFHLKCIYQWTTNNLTCPYCRSNLKIITDLRDTVDNSINYQFKKKHKCKYIKLNDETIYDSYYQLINQCPIGFLQDNNSILPIYLLQGNLKYYINHHLRQIILWCRINSQDIYSYEDDYGRLIYNTRQKPIPYLSYNNCNIMYNWIHELMTELSNIYIFSFTIDMNSILMDLTVNTIKYLKIPVSKCQTAVIVSIYQILKNQRMYHLPTDDLTVTSLINVTNNISSDEDFNKYFEFQNKYIRKNIKIL